MRAHFSRSAARRRISRPPSPLHSLATLRAAMSPATACMVGRGSHTNFENARQLLSAISSTRASLRGASGLPLSQCRGTRPQSRLPQMPSHRLRRRRQRGNHRAGPSLSSITLRRPLLSGTCLQLHGHTGGGEGLEVRNWHAWRCRHYRRAVLHAHVRHKHRRAGRRRARRWQVAAGLQAAVPSSAALRCSRRPSPPPSAPGNRSRARRLSSPGHGGSGSSSRWQCLLASVCRRARFAARVPTLLSTSMRSPDWVHRPLVASGAALLRGRSRSP